MLASLCCELSAKYDGQYIRHAYVRLDYREGPFTLLRQEKIESAIACLKDSIFHLIQTLVRVDFKAMIEQISQNIEDISEENNAVKLLLRKGKYPS